MCGILGLVDIAYIPEQLEAVRHRGPDASGVTVFDSCGRHVIFGHRRLAIVDLSPAGIQPMTTADGSCAIVFNGEIYNHAQLRAGLSGVQWRGHSDTETLLHAVAAGGIQVSRDLNGMFAFAFLDRRVGKLYLARDPFGIKPLYYARIGTGFAFASEIAPLLMLRPAEVDRDALATLLRIRYVPSPGTLFRGIRKVAPGHILEIDLTRPEMSVHEHQFAAPPPEPINIRWDEAQQIYGEFVDAAVRRQLMSDVEVGVLLSGGVDSALIAHIAQKHSSKRLKAFTVGFAEETNVDELINAQETAANVGLEHITVRVGATNFSDALRRCTRAVEEPIATTSIVPMYALAELASSHVKVVLSGQGADEALGGYTRYRAALLHDHTPQLARSILSYAATHVKSHRHIAGRALAVAAAETDALRYICSHAVFSTDEVRALTGLDGGESVAAIEVMQSLLATSHSRGSASKMMSLDLRSELSDDLLLYTDKITMRCSLECRVPMLDLELVRFLEALPEQYKVTLSSGKRIHKALAGQVLPAAIAKRKKNPFSSPARSWLNYDRSVKEMLSESGTTFSQYFEVAAVRSLLQSALPGADKRIFLLASICMWMEEYLAKPAASQVSAALCGTALGLSAAV